VALRNSEVCNLLDDGEAQFKRSNNNRRLHVPLFDLGLCRKTCIVPCHELPELVIDESSVVFFLDCF
jgi:thymidylate synthase